MFIFLLIFLPLCNNLIFWNFVSALAQHNLKPEDIDFVVCTHSHADHIGNNNLFLNAEHIVGFTVHRGSTFYEKNLQEGNLFICR